MPVGKYLRQQRAIGKKMG